MGEYIFWGLVIYTVIAVIWRLVMAGLMVAGMYQAEGLKGALMAGVANLVVGIWDALKFVIFIVILIYLYRACNPESESSASLGEGLESISSQMNQTLPRQVDEYSTMISTKVNGNKLTYIYRVDIENLLTQYGITSTEFAILQKQRTTSLRCETDNPAFAFIREHNIVIANEFYNLENGLICEVQADNFDCEN